MKRAVLADSGPLFALADRGDQHHARAVKEAARLRRRSQMVVVAYSTLVECHALVVHRLGPRYARQWLAELLASTRRVNPADLDFLAAFQLLGDFADQSLTLADAVLAVLSQRLELPVWTYDHHFDVVSAHVWR